MLNFVRRNKKQGFISIWAIISLFIGTITAILIFAYISIIFNIVPGLNKYRAYQKIKELRIAALSYSSNISGNIYSKNKDIIPALVKYGDLNHEWKRYDGFTHKNSCFAYSKISKVFNNLTYCDPWGGYYEVITLKQNFFEIKLQNVPKSSALSLAYWFYNQSSGVFFNGIRLKPHDNLSSAPTRGSFSVLRRF